MRSLRTIALLAVAVGLLLTMVTPAQAKVRVTPVHFGIHSFSTDPLVPAGTIRMNCWPNWRLIEAKQDQYDWAAADWTFSQVAAWGIKDVQFVFCGTPEWAAGPVKQPQLEVFGKGSTAAPSLADWRDFVTRFVLRYRDRVDSYQAWNEITSPQFYQGSAAQMAAMTRELKQIVAAHDPTARVVSASVQTHRPEWYASMAVPYFRALKAAGWPVDAFAGHFYPAGKGGPDQRIAQINMLKKTLRQLRAPKRQVWDTEGNFWTGVPGQPKAGRVRGAKAATFVARNYLDAWRTGVTRSYWYLWSAGYEAFAGVQLRKGDAGTRAYNTLASWTIGATMGRCKQKGQLVTCPFTGKKGRFVIAFTTKRTSKLKVAGTRTMCPVTGGKCRTAKGKVKITTVPVRIG